MFQVHCVTIHKLLNSFPFFLIKNCRSVNHPGQVSQCTEHLFLLFGLTNPLESSAQLQINPKSGHLDYSYLIYSD